MLFLYFNNHIQFAVWYCYFEVIELNGQKIIVLFLHYFQTVKYPTPGRRQYRSTAVCSLI